MTVFQSMILGLVQGVAEFLPISSSGHLLLARRLLGLQEIPVLFDVILHLPSLLAVCIFFRKKIARLFSALFRLLLKKPAGEKLLQGQSAAAAAKSDGETKNAAALGAEQNRLQDQNAAANENGLQDQNAPGQANDELTGSEALARKTIAAVFATTFVTGAIGVFTSRLLDGLPIKAVFCGFLFTALLLIASGIIEKRRALGGKKSAANKDSTQGQNSAAENSANENATQDQNSANEKSTQGQKSAARFGESADKGGISLKQAAFVGLMQGIGTLPGVSRSGSTISGALFAGVSRAAAGEYSFIVSIPAILAAFLLEARRVGKVVQAGVGAAAILAACLVCFAAAYASLAFLMRLVKKGRLEWFALYLVPLGVAGLILL